MKHVILSADEDRAVYLVPDAVADALEKYCLEFANDWLHHSPDAKRFRIKGGVCYSESDFIEYLNQYVFPQEKSMLIENLGCLTVGGDLPEKYRGCPCFAF